MNTTLDVEIAFEGAYATMTFTDFPVRIGRSQGCDLRLPFVFVSRHHARIDRDGSGLVLVHDGGRNGIAYNGVRLAPDERKPIADGGVVAIEDLIIHLRVTETTEPYAFDHATTLYSDEELVPEALAHVSLAIEDYRAARENARTVIDRTLRTMRSRERDAIARRIAEGHPDILRDGAFADVVDWSTAPERAAPPLPITPNHAVLVAEFDERIAYVLRDLSPAAIERANRSAWWRLPFRSRSLWKTFVERYNAHVATVGAAGLEAADE